MRKDPRLWEEINMVKPKKIKFNEIEWKWEMYLEIDEALQNEILTRILEFKWWRYIDIDFKRYSDGRFDEFWFGVKRKIKWIEYSSLKLPLHGLFDHDLWNIPKSGTEFYVLSKFIKIYMEWELNHFVDSLIEDGRVVLFIYRNKDKTNDEIYDILMSNSETKELIDFLFSWSDVSVIAFLNNYNFIVQTIKLQCPSFPEPLSFDLEKIKDESYKKWLIFELIDKVKNNLPKETWSELTDVLEALPEVSKLKKRSVCTEKL